jgi:hypothetical protein
MEAGLDRDRHRRAGSSTELGEIEMSDAGKPKSRAPYTPPALKPVKMFVEAGIPGCCKVSLTACGDPVMRSGGGGQGKGRRASSTS